LSCDQGVSDRHATVDHRYTLIRRFDTKAMTKSITSLLPCCSSESLELVNLLSVSGASLLFSTRAETCLTSHFQGNTAQNKLVIMVANPMITVRVNCIVMIDSRSLPLSNPHRHFPKPWEIYRNLCDLCDALCSFDSRYSLTLTFPSNGATPPGLMNLWPLCLVGMGHSKYCIGFSSMPSYEGKVPQGFGNIL
jgi:hypothetical protein